MATKLLNPTLYKLLEDFRLDIKYVKGEGLFLYDENGNKYMDFIAQYGAVPFGYNHPDIAGAVKDYFDSGLPSMIQPSVPVKALELAELLIKMAPGEMAHATFCQSGAEAVEAGIKMARSKTGKIKILSTENSFHGKTMGALSATGRNVYQEPFFAPSEGFEKVPFDNLDALERKLKADSEHISAFIVEPIQGEGGIIIPREGYLKQAEMLCRRYGVLFIVDEIQTGLGRTGELFACCREEVKPDILLLSKALGGGLVPIGVCLSSADAWNEDFGRLHSSTFANNNFTCSVSIAVLNTLKKNREEIVKNAGCTGRRLLDGLYSINDRYPGIIAEIRGRGLMTGLEFNSPDGSESFSLRHLAEEGGFSALLAGYLLHAENIRVAPFLNNPMTLRLQPALTVTEEDIDRALAAIDQVTQILYYRDYSELFGYIIGVKPTKTIRDYRNKLKPVRGSKLETGEKPEGKFAFLIHYPSDDDAAKNNISFERLHQKSLKRLLDWEASSEADPHVIVHMPAIKSKAGKIAEGWLIGIPYSGKHLTAMPRKEAVAHLSKAVDFARDLGAKIVGLGAYTSVVSRGGADLQGRGVFVTSGNSYTIATAFDALMEAAGPMGIETCRATGSVVGATGSIGRVCAMMLAEEVSRLVLVGNPDKGQSSMRRLKKLADEIYERHLLRLLAGKDVLVSKGLSLWLKGFLEYCNTSNPGLIDELKSLLQDRGRGSIYTLINNNLAKEGPFSKTPLRITINIKEACKMSDLVISASSSTANLIGPEFLKSGSVVCDVARPADVSKAVLETRPDVLVIEGGLVRYPDEICFGQNMGYEPGINLACLSETVILALEGVERDFSIGTKISIEEVSYLKELAGKHGFKLAKTQNELGEVTKEIIEAVRDSAAGNSCVSEQVLVGS